MKAISGALNLDYNIMKNIKFYSYVVLYIIELDPTPTR